MKRGPKALLVSCASMNLLLLLTVIRFMYLSPSCLSDLACTYFLKIFSSNNIFSTVFFQGMVKLVAVHLWSHSRMPYVTVKQLVTLSSICRTSNQQSNTAVWLLWLINYLDHHKWTAAFTWSEIWSLHLLCACSKMMRPCIIMCYKLFIKS